MPDHRETCNPSCVVPTGRVFVLADDVRLDLQGCRRARVRNPSPPGRTLQRGNQGANLRVASVSAGNIERMKLPQRAPPRLLGQGLTRDAQSFRRPRDRQAERLQALPADDATGMGGLCIGIRVVRPSYSVFSPRCLNDTITMASVLCRPSPDNGQVRLACDASLHQVAALARCGELRHLPLAKAGEQDAQSPHFRWQYRMTAPWATRSRNSRRPTTGASCCW